MKFEGLTVTASEPQTLISLDAAKAQLHVLDDFEDAKISDCMEAAVSYCETVLWQSLRVQTVTAAYSADGEDWAELPRAPFGSLAEIRYYAPDGSLREIDAETVTVDASLFVPRAYFPEPETARGMFAPIKITYKTAQAAAPAPEIRQAALIATAQFFDNRDAPDLSAVDRILTPLRTRYFL